MRKKGFTLIELLVVIAVIALLMAVIVPALRKAKEAAKGVLCRSNLRQMSLAFGVYSQENDGRMFPLAYDENYWLRKIAPYLDDKYFQQDPVLDGTGAMGVSICPSTKIQTANLSNGNAPNNKETWAFDSGGGTLIVGSYSINCWLLTDPRDPPVIGITEYENWGGTQANTVGRYFERYSVARADAGLLVGAFRMDTWPDPVQEDQDENNRIPKSDTLEPGNMTHSPNYFMRRIIPDRHGFAVNVAFVGGYVEKVDLEDLGMVSWSKKSSPVELFFDMQN